MGDEEPATLDGQFYEFSKIFDTEKKRDGTTINLYRNDYWMRQAKILDDRKVTMTDTGIIWWKWSAQRLRDRGDMKYKKKTNVKAGRRVGVKTELNWDEWYEFLTDLCVYKDLEQEMVENNMTNCGIPGTATVYVPQYRDFFDTYKPKDKLLF